MKEVLNALMLQTTAEGKKTWSNDSVADFSSNETVALENPKLGSFDFR